MSIVTIRPNAEGTYTEFPHSHPLGIIELNVNFRGILYDEWVEVGVPPYLDAMGDGNYIYSTRGGERSNYFAFQDAPPERVEPIEIARVYLLSKQSAGGDDRIEVYLSTDLGVTWNLLGAITPSDVDWGLDYLDATPYLDTWEKINNARIYLVHDAVAKADTVYADHAYLRIWYTTPHWQQVDEETPDEDETYIEGSFTTTTPTKDSFQHENITLPSGAVIEKVRVYMRVKRVPYVFGLYPRANTLIRTYNTDYLGSTVWAPIDYITYYTEYLTNPFTGNPWSQDEVNALEAGLQGTSDTDNTWWSVVRDTQNYVEVYYIVVARILGEGLVWITG